MTYGMSLRKWYEAGILSRELKPYNELAKYFDKIFIVTYGGSSELFYRSPKHMAKNIFILYNNTLHPDFVYSLLAPWIHRDVLKNVDILKTNQTAGSWSAVIAKKLFGKKLFIRQGYPWLQTLEEKNAPLWKRILAGLTEKLAYNAADGIIMTTERDKREIQRNYHVPEEKVHVIPNYIDTDLFKPDPSLRQANRILYVGRLEHEKNLIQLILAVEGLDVELIIIGEGSIRRQLETLVKDKGITNTRFLGRMPNKSLPQEYNQASVFVQPSWYEGNPKTFMEAMACGCLVIGTDVRGINSLIQHEKNGYLCGLSASHIRGAIIVAHHTSQTCDGKKLRENARATIVGNYSSENTVAKEMKLYKEEL